MSFYQIPSWTKHYPKLQTISESKKKEILRLSRRAGNAPVPPRLHIHHTKRFLQWFREHIIADPLLNKSQIEKNKDENADHCGTDFSLYYPKKHNFNLAIYQRKGNLANGYSHMPAQTSNRISSVSHTKAENSHVQAESTQSDRISVKADQSQIALKTKTEPKKVQPPQNAQKFSIGKKLEKKAEEKRQEKKPEEKKSIEKEEEEIEAKKEEVDVKVEK